MPASLAGGLLLVLSALIPGCGSVDEDAVTIESPVDPDPAAGRRMYRAGILPSGEPLTAIVAGDVPVLGTQFSCQSCHGRSGMGAAEGTYIVPAIAGRFLFAPSPQPARPAYDAQSLARVLRDGMTPGGRILDPLMPRYRLTDIEVEALASYLAELSAGSSPGVDDKVIRFATVITEDVTEEERKAVLAVLNRFIEEKNRQTRLESERFDRGSTPASRLPTVYREWVLEEWTLTGPSDSWTEQLESRYRNNPVFALLGGLSKGSWKPIGRFCERNEIPCLFPGTRLPDAETDDFYTLYFSRGLELEADLIANHLDSNTVGAVVQVYCDTAPAQVVENLRIALEKKGVTSQDLAFDCAEPLPVNDLAKRLGEFPDTAAILWLERDQLAKLERPLPAGRLYVSSTLLQRKVNEPLLTAPGPVYLAHPFRLPGELDSALSRFRAWAKTRDVEITYPRLQAETFFACIAGSDAIKHLGRFFVRDYVLDMLDHAQGLAAYVPFHPRPTLGPHQRFLNKGGYVLPVLNGQLDASDAVWILP